MGTISGKDDIDRARANHMLITGTDDTHYIRKHNISYLYHMTAISNLRSILEHGLLSHNEAHRLKLVSRDISDPEVQDRRADKREPIYEKKLHDYVPLYFSPRNPMLYKRVEIQDNIVILGINPNVILEPTTVFSDGNAAAQSTGFYHDVAMLDKLPWNIINSSSWSEFIDGRRIKCAEVLISLKVEVKNIFNVLCYSGSQLLTVHNVIRTIKAIPRSISISVQVKQELFF